MIALSVALICASALTAQCFHYAFQREAREHKDTLLLGNYLEARIKEVLEMKGQIEKLSFQQGLRR